MARQKITAEQWNERHPIGTPVRAYPILDNEQTAFDTKTRSEAWNLGDGSPVAKIEGRTGGYLLEALKVLPKGEG